MGSFLSFLTATYYLPKLYFADSQVYVRAKVSPNSEKDPVRLSLHEYIVNKCPSLLKPFRPAWWLYSGHLQTGYCVVGDFSQIDKVEYDRTLLRTVDGVVVVLHGLTGGSHEAYVRAILAPVCTPVEQGGLGYRGIVVNFRGCAGVPITSPQLYSAGHTDDIRVAIWHIARRYPRARLIGVGFSLGANVLTRYIAEEGIHCRLAAGCVLACPWDTVMNSEQLENHWLHRTVYSKAMAQNLQKLIRRHFTALSGFTDHPVSQTVHDVLALKSPTLVQFDDTVTRLAGGSSPPFPFATARDYYAWAASDKVLPDIRIPFLAISSEDDPIVQLIPVDAGGNGFVALAVTKKGGHLGWFEADQRFGRVNRWIRRPVVEWIRAACEDLIPEERDRKELHILDGFVTEVGREGIGCKEVAGGGHVVGVEDEEGLLAGL
ncbi:hypothetical protein CERSUDRAFT_113689 [Gelatoporia subvermispora B]|uniref:AB hydrolase-1 domain-containing protein n=1 Tax=Ceriporiopsis subvermispora (strain B) TaxID=914234 RepID=M2PPR9_CERS8|nr:hypothetical protein CERSUDRAFT_113689 [Gelatoporia subvermispora B]